MDLLSQHCYRDRAPKLTSHFFLGSSFNPNQNYTHLGNLVEYKFSFDRRILLTVTLQKSNKIKTRTVE